MDSLNQKLSAKSDRKGYKKIQFFSCKREIEEAISSGYSLQIIWEQLHTDNRIHMSYSNFTRYVREFIYHTSRSLKPIKNIANLDQSDRNNSTLISSAIAPNSVQEIEQRNKKISEDEERKLKRAKLEEVRKRQEEEREKNKFFHPSTPRDIKDLV